MKNLSDITAAILAGGLGTRLRPAINGRPKVLAEVGGRPFLTYLFDQLLEVQVKRAVLCTGYLGDQIEARMGESYKSIHLEYSQEARPLGTGGALRLAMPLLVGDVILVMNGDSYIDANLKALSAVHRLRQAKATILLKEKENTDRYGSVAVEEDGRIAEFLEKSKREAPGWINAGVYLIHRSFLEAIPPDRAISLEEELLPSWIGQGLYGFRSQGKFIDIGTPESFASAEGFFTQEAGRPKEI